MNSRRTLFSPRLSPPKDEGSGLFSSFFDVGFSSRGGGEEGSFSCFGGAGVSFFGSSCFGFSSFFATGLDVVGCLSEAGSFGGALASCLPPLPPSPGSSFAMSCPTVTVSPSLTRNSLIVPASGAFTETSIWGRCVSRTHQKSPSCLRTLSVSIEAISSSRSTESPGCLLKELSVPSEMDSAISGTLTMISACRNGVVLKDAFSGNDIAVLHVQVGLMGRSTE